MDFFDSLYDNDTSDQKIRVSRMAKTQNIPLKPLSRGANDYIGNSGSEKIPEPLIGYFNMLGAELPEPVRIQPTRTVFSFEQDSSTIISQVESQIRVDRENHEYIKNMEHSMRNQVITDIQQLESVESSESSFDSVFYAEIIEPLISFRELALHKISIPEEVCEQFDINNLKPNEIQTESAVAVISRIINAGRSSVFLRLLQMGVQNVGGEQLELW